MSNRVHLLNAVVNDQIPVRPWALPGFSSSSFWYVIYKKHFTSAADCLGNPPGQPRHLKSLLKLTGRLNQQSFLWWRIPSRRWLTSPPGSNWDRLQNLSWPYHTLTQSAMTTFRRCPFPGTLSTWRAYMPSLRKNRTTSLLKMVYTWRLRSTHDDGNSGVPDTA